MDLIDDLGVIPIKESCLENDENNISEDIRAISFRGEPADTQSSWI